MIERRVLVGLPLYEGHIHYECHVTVENMMQAAADRGFSVKPYYARGPSLPIKRRQCVEEARKWEAEWLLMVDSDMIIKDHNALWKLISRKKAVISGVYYGKQPPWVPIAAKYADPEYHPTGSETIDQMLLVKYNTLANIPEDSIIEIDGVGGGLLLLKTAVFDKLRKPYFCMGEIFEEGMTKVQGIGEDYFLCQRLHEVGIKIHLDTTVQCEHIGNYMYGQKDHLLGQEIGRLKAQRESKPEGFEVVTV